LVAEAEAAGQHAAFHAGIAGPALDVLAHAVAFVRTTPATHRFPPAQACIDGWIELYAEYSRKESHAPIRFGCINLVYEPEFPSNA
jgi:hypothetical protein